MTPISPTILTTGLALVLSTGMALADDKPEMTIDPAIDVNGDDLYSFVELSNLFPEFLADTFTIVDTNGDGLLDLTEVRIGTNGGLMPVMTE